MIFIHGFWRFVRGLRELRRTRSIKERPSGLRAILHPGLEATAAVAIPEFGIAFAVGPEGGFTLGEVNAAEAAGWLRMSLGPRVLRVETAAIAAASWAAFNNPGA